MCQSDRGTRKVAIHRRIGGISFFQASRQFACQRLKENLFTQFFFGLTGLAFSFHGDIRSCQ
jgi:hypothetical protein